MPILWLAIGAALGALATKSYVEKHSVPLVADATSKKLQDLGVDKKAADDFANAIKSAHK